MISSVKTWFPCPMPLPRLLAFATLSGFSTGSFAQQELPGLASGFAQMLLGLGVVIALLLATLWLIKRLSAPRGPSAGLKVLGGVAIGSRERLVLVEVGDKVLVLGVTANSINTLHTTDAGDLALAPPPAGTNRREPEFAGWLRRSLEQRKDGT